MKNTDERVKFAKEILEKDLMLEFFTKDPGISANEKMKMDNAIFEKARAFVEKDTTLDTIDFDTLISLSAMLIRERKPLSNSFPEFIAGVLEGKIKRPISRGRCKYSNFKRDLELMLAVGQVNEKFNVPLYYNNDLLRNITEDGTPTTAAGIVSIASKIKVDTVITAYKNYSKHWG
jgi:hypothetical protein